MNQFTLTAEHIALLRGMYVSWGDYSPCIDEKRPYGNSGWSRYEDMNKLIGSPYEIDIETLQDHSEIMAALDNLHAEMETALQIVLATGSFTPGVYRQAMAYHARSWEMVTAEDV